MKQITKRLMLLLLVLFSSYGFSQTARVQVIHNSPDAAAAVVDVYLNDALLLDDFKFRTGTKFIDAPAGTPIKIDIAAGESTSNANPVYSVTTTLSQGKTYVIVANGIVSASGYSSAPNFGLSIYDQGREIATNSSNTDVLVNHGSPDAPTVDVVESKVTNGATIVQDLSYPNFNPYLELPTSDYVLEVRDQTGAVVVASYLAPLQTLGLQGQALSVVASGFLDPSKNSDGPAFGLWVALADGPNLVNDLIELPKSTARVQVIHNSPDAAAAVVDVYLNDALLLDDFKFRTGTKFIDAPAGTPIKIDIAAGDSTSNANPVYSVTTTLTQGKTYVIVANGIVSASGYSSAPNFGLSIYDQGREIATNPSNTDVLVNHGSPDAPTVDVVESKVTNGATIVQDLSYPNFNPYLELPTSDYVLEVRDQTGTVVVASYLAPLQTLGLQGQALSVIASGFLDPSKNSDGPAFGLWVALADGPNLVNNLIELPKSTARVQVIHNSPDAAAAVVDVYLNDALLLDDFKFRTGTKFIDAPAGTPIKIDIATGDSTSNSNPVYSVTTTLTQGKTYVIVANGIVSASGYSSAPNFGLSIYDQGRETATNPSNTDVLVNHGSPDAPTVDVVESKVTNGATIVQDLSYPNFNPYLELPTSDYVLEVRDQTGTVVVASYLAPLQTLGLQGQALSVIASGFLDPSKNSDGPAFGLWVALADGPNLVNDLIELPEAALSTNGFKSSSINIYPNPTSSILYIAIPFNYNDVSGKIVDINGRILKSFQGINNTIDVTSLSSGMYVLELKVDESFISKKIIINN